MNQPDCFGDLAKVFPMGADGLRHSPAECQACPDKVACLKAALATPVGAAVKRGGAGADGPASRALTGFKRWSALKSARKREPR